MVVRWLALHRLMPPVIMVVFVMFWGCAASLAAPPPYCAYEVVVRDPVGQAVVNVPVGLVVDGTQRETVSTDSDGKARLCDAPLRRVDIGVGNSRCGAVLIKNLRPPWPDTLTVPVTYQRMSCEGFLGPDSCTVLLRVLDQAGQPIEGVGFYDRATGRNVQESDRFGRLFWVVPPGKVVSGAVKKEGYVPAQFAQPCVPSLVKDFEVRLTLREAPGAR